MKKHFTLIALLLSAVFYAQNFVQGKIFIEEEGKKTPALGVDVYWKGTNIGTISSENGNFKIIHKPEYKTLIISYLGFKTEQITIHNLQDFISVVLQQEANEIQGIEVISKRKPTEKLYSKTANVININSGELLKAACCNLSDSFETNTSVDVSFSDALTGVKQIKMLGLSSPYLLVSQENMPTLRGASQAYGMTFIPGTWVESIQIIKGSGSVINGYESIAGQINTELVKPMLDKPFYLNAFVSGDGRMELNTHINGQVSKKWYSGFYTHGNYQNRRMDMNHDGFLDMPLGSQLNLMNRWQYVNEESGWISNFIINYVKDDRILGEKNFSTIKNPYLWGAKIETNQFNISAKSGYIWQDLPFQSIGFQASYKYHQQDSFFGNNIYNIGQHSGYFNAIFKSIFGNTLHKFSTGINSTFDKIDEFIQVNPFANAYYRTDYGIGAFFEYAFDNTENFSYTLGARYDFNNQLGFFLTPRLHFRYLPWEKGVFRVSAGQGRRIANIFAENQKFFSSSRKIQIYGQGGKIYGLSPEVAWNYGISLLQGFHLFERQGDVSVDFYRTDFHNQIVVDWENPTQISFYNLEGKSSANSLQIELNYEILPRFSLKTAYKNYLVQTTYKSGKKLQPLQPKERFFLNLAYDTKLKNEKQWRFDYTFNWIGKQRLPSTTTSPLAYQLPDFAPSYYLMNTQITRIFAKNFEVYLGAENLLDYQQKNAIISSENPFGTHFDSSLIYAPVFGRMIYAGLRFNFNFNNK